MNTDKPPMLGYVKEQDINWIHWNTDISLFSSVQLIINQHWIQVIIIWTDVGKDTCPFRISLLRSKLHWISIMDVVGLEFEQLDISDHNIDKQLIMSLLTCSYGICTNARMNCFFLIGKHCDHMHFVQIWWYCLIFRYCHYLFHSLLSNELLA